MRGGGIIDIMKKTQFQRDFKMKDAIEIVKIWHPDLSIEQIVERIKCGPSSYCWCEIKFKVKGYGNVQLGISNYNCHTLWGSVSRQSMIEAKERGEIKFHVWRFAMDKLYDNEKYGSPERKVLEDASAQYLLKHYKIMSIDEFFNQYYED